MFYTSRALGKRLDDTEVFQFLRHGRYTARHPQQLYKFGLHFWYNMQPAVSLSYLQILFSEVQCYLARTTLSIIKGIFDSS